MLPKSEKIWMSGKLVPWDDAKIHIGSHVVHFGTSVFKGIRCFFGITSGDQEDKYGWLTPVG